MHHEFEILSWDESSYLDINERSKFTRATIRKKYTGTLQGEGRLDYLMAYDNEGNATFVGIERVTGSIDGRTGSFSLREEGVFANGVVASYFTVIEGSAEGELSKLKGGGHYKTGEAPKVSFEFNYTV